VLADWVLVQDMGFLGGTGTDPNSMIPYVLLGWAGYRALARPLPWTAAQPCPRRRTARDSLTAAAEAIAGDGFRSAVSFAAIGVFMLGAGPLAAARAVPVTGGGSLSLGVTRAAITERGSAGFVVGGVMTDGQAEREESGQ
jgi:hypothetical protein